jgi:co-chaperonin GroES (HSP10)
VITVGPEAESISPGDKVLFPKDAGYDVRLAGTAQRVLKREDLIARILD